MDILVLSIVAGLVVVGGIWMVTRETKPEDTIGRHAAPVKSTLHNSPAKPAKFNLACSVKYSG